MYVGLSKYEFYEGIIHHLGQIISNRGISIDPEKIEAMMIWPTPRKLTDVIYFWDMQDIAGSSLKNILQVKWSLCIGRGSLHVNL